MPEFILEGIATVEGVKISGVALREGISKKGNKYTEDQIKTAKNLGVPLPLKWEHRGPTVGEITFSWDDTQKALIYEGMITSPTKSFQLKNGKYGVSVEAEAEQVITDCEAQYCHPKPINLSLSGLAIATIPATFGTSVEIRESMQSWPEQKHEKCDHCIAESIEQTKEELTKKISELESKITEITTCKKCGGKKKL